MTDVRLIHGSALHIPLDDESVQCVVTSPPYWGLRQYAGEQIVPEWGCALGLEPTPELYVEHIVAIFREVRRVLRADGTLWLNLGDSYAANRSYQVTDNKHVDVGNTMGARVPDGLKPKDLVGIPWMVAFALRADGWYLRSDIIWHKPNPMPESVTDRPTKSHEYLFLLTKSERYYYDADAIREPSITNDPRRPYTSEGAWQMDGRPEEQRKSGQRRDGEDFSGRNKRTVWTIPTRPYKGAHFATFPPDLVEPCVLAGSKVGDTVLDPFNGSGTTGQVAVRLGRSYVGVDISKEYLDEQAGRRIYDVQMEAAL